MFRTIGVCGRASIVALWRALQPRSAGQHKAHSFQVLHLAQAVTPPLALARARAGLLLRIIEHGPASLRQLLFLQWEANPQRSWLGQLEHDIRHVSLYCPAARLLLDDPSPVHALVAAIQDDRTWWKRQIRAADRLCLQDLRTWSARQSEVPAVPSASQAPDGLNFQLALLRRTCHMHVLSVVIASCCESTGGRMSLGGMGCRAPHGSMHTTRPVLPVCATIIRSRAFSGT